MAERHRPWFSAPAQLLGLDEWRPPPAPEGALAGLFCTGATCAWPTTSPGAACRATAAVTGVYVIDPGRAGWQRIQSVARLWFLGGEGLRRTPAKAGAPPAANCWLLHGDPVALLPRLAATIGAGVVAWNREVEPGRAVSGDRKSGRTLAGPLGRESARGREPACWFPPIPSAPAVAIPSGSMGPYWRRWRNSWRRGPPPPLTPTPAPSEPAGSGRGCVPMALEERAARRAAKALEIGQPGCSLRRRQSAPAGPWCRVGARRSRLERLQPWRPCSTTISRPQPARRKRELRAQRRPALRHPQLPVRPWPRPRRLRPAAGSGEQQPGDHRLGAGAGLARVLPAGVASISEPWPTAPTGPSGARFPWRTILFASGLVRGLTGVRRDAAMRQLNARRAGCTNRCRMIVASFLVKDLISTWRWASGAFMEPLVRRRSGRHNAAGAVERQQRHMDPQTATHLQPVHPGDFALRCRGHLHPFGWLPSWPAWPPPKSAQSAPSRPSNARLPAADRGAPAATGPFSSSYGGLCASCLRLTGLRQAGSAAQCASLAPGR